MTEKDFQKIVTNPILDIAARYWDNDRYEAFKICYKSMRIIDDFVDDRKVINKKISLFEKKTFKIKINHWIKAIENNNSNNKLQDQILKTIHKFKIPS